VVTPIRARIGALMAMRRHRALPGDGVPTLAAWDAQDRFFMSSGPLGVDPRAVWSAFVGGAVSPSRPPLVHRHTLLGRRYPGIQVRVVIARRGRRNP
jgi:hypothetical protein